MRQRGWFVRTIAAGVFLATAIAFAQGSAHASEQVTVASVSMLRKGIQRFQAIQNKGTAIANINALLADYDQRALRAATDCDSSLAGGEKQVNPGEESWKRTVDVTMRGPHYVSYVARDSYFCGGAHPNAETFALVFDLHTGKLVDWTKLFARGSASGQMQTNGDGSEVRTVSSASLVKVYVGKVLSKLDKDCGDAIRSEDFASGFTLWPDAKAGSLFIHPNLSHATAACGEDVSLTVEEQRDLGVSEEIVEAIRAAHAVQSSSK